MPRATPSSVSTSHESFREVLTELGVALGMNLDYEVHAEGYAQLGEHLPRVFQGLVHLDRRPEELHRSLEIRVAALPLREGGRGQYYGRLLVLRARQVVPDREEFDALGDARGRGWAPAEQCLDSV